MRKSIKSFIAMFILVLGVLQISTVVFAKTDIPSATSDFYVNDFAGIFSADEKSRLMDNAVALSDEHDGIQVVITTITSLDGNTIENYALEMYNQYGIGKDDMGLLILLSTGDRQIRVEVGKAMEAYITDSKAGRFLDTYAIPYLKENKFNEGLINLQEALIAEIVASLENSSDVQPSTPKSSFDFSSILGTFLIICIIVGVLALIVFLVRKIIVSISENQETINFLTQELEKEKRHINQVLAVNKQEYDALECQLQTKIDHLAKERDTLASNYEILKNSYNILKDRYERVQRLYPTADNDVTSMIEDEIRQKDMNLAAKVNAVIEEVINLPASKDIISKLNNARCLYSDLSQAQKSYVKSDINKLDALYYECLRLKEEYDRLMEEKRKKQLAATALASITAIISCISFGKARNFRILQEAKSIYNNLESGARLYFDQSVADRLDRLYREAKRDKEEIEEAERRRKQEEEERRRRREEEERRRRMQSSSHSGFRSSSHHGGFGGRSGGGGASRGF